MTPQEIFFSLMDHVHASNFKVKQELSNLDLNGEEKGTLEKRCHKYSLLRT